MKVLIVAAGTGGHITPGISIANKIKHEDRNSEILFVGTKTGIENEIIKNEGYKIEHIRAEGIRRELTLQNLRRIFSILLGIGDAKKIIDRFKPDIVIGTGGYVCYPIMKVATSMKIPTILHESNAIPGRVVTSMAKKVDTILLGFEMAKDKIKNAKNVVFTGTPTKMSTYIPDENLYEKLDLNPDKPVILVTGGSQGAKKINEYIVDIMCNEQEKSYQLVFVTGPKNYEQVISNINNKGCKIETLKDIKILPYAYNMEEYVTCADLLISRAGALSLAEICVMGKPSILIPYPFAAENHQEFNAKILHDGDAAISILEKDLNSDKLNAIINEVIQDKEKLFTMGKNARKLATLNVEEKIYVEIKKLLIGKI